jgi:hypothetical protein
MIRVPDNTSPDFCLFVPQTLKPLATSTKDVPLSEFVTPYTFKFEYGFSNEEYPLPRGYSLPIPENIKIKGQKEGPKIIIPAKIPYGNEIVAIASEFKAGEDTRFRKKNNMDTGISDKIEEKNIRLLCKVRIPAVQSASFHSNPPCEIKTVRIPILIKGSSLKKPVKAYIEYTVSMHCLYLNSNYVTNTTTKFLFVGMDMLQGRHIQTKFPPTEEFVNMISDEHRETKSHQKIKIKTMELYHKGIITKESMNLFLEILYNEAEIYNVSPVTDTYGIRSRKNSPLNVKGCGINRFPVPCSDGVFSIYGLDNKIVETQYNPFDSNYLPVLVLPEDVTQSCVIYKSKKAIESGRSLTISAKGSGYLFDFA